MIPDSIKQAVKSRFASRPQYGWFGNYPTWSAASAKCSGYDNAVILEKVKAAVLKVKNGEAAYERDSVLFDRFDYSQPLLDAFKLIARANNGNLHILDFGGSLGSSYFQNKQLLADVGQLRWSIVEQAHFVDCGKQNFENDELKFYYTVDEALKRAPVNVLFLSSVVQYFEKPYALIRELIAHNFEYIIVDRTAFIDSKKERITVQIVPESIYKASYPAWFFNEKQFREAFSPNYVLLHEIESKFDPRERLEDGVLSYRKGFLFKRK